MAIDPASYRQEIIETVPVAASPAATASGSCRRRIRLLIASHILAYCLSALFVGFVNPYAYFPLQVLIVSQLCLVAIWCGLGAAPWWWRLSGGVAGIVCGFVLGNLPTSIYLSQTLPVIDSLITAGGWMMFQFGVQVLAISGALLTLRLWSTRLYLVHTPVSAPSPPRWRFSVLQILMLTAVVAVVVGMGQQVDAWVRRSQSWQGFSFSFLFMTHFVAGVQESVVALFAVWALLSIYRPPLRFAVALLLTLAIGLISPFLYTRYWWSVYSSLLMSVGIFIIVAITLLVMRSCGYRLCRSTKPTPAPENEGRFLAPG